jgi:hypothetical protein
MTKRALVPETLGEFNSNIRGRVYLLVLEGGVATERYLRVDINLNNDVPGFLSSWQFINIIVALRDRLTNTGRHCQHM